MVCTQHPSRQPPNIHAGMAAWLAARGNKGVGKATLSRARYVEVYTLLFFCDFFESIKALIHENCKICIRLMRDISSFCWLNVCENLWYNDVSYYTCVSGSFCATAESCRASPGAVRQRTWYNQKAYICFC